MFVFASIFDWFTGGAEHPYHTLYHCMAGDTLWVAITVTLDLAVAAGYGLIVLHWRRNERHMPPVPARRALATMRNIFLFCCICGYTFIPIKMFWPAWRLYDLFMAALVYFTWRYALSSKELKVVYTELGRSARLGEELQKSQEEGRRKTAFLNAISHDLRTPLNGIALQTEVARVCATEGDADGVQAAMAQIESNSRAAAELLETLLECARLDFQESPNRPETFALVDLLRDAMAAVQPAAAAKGLYLQATGAGQLEIRTDRHKLGRSLANLLSNAVKFTQVGGVRVAVESGGESIELHVIDSGLGLSPEQQGRVFEEFYQAGNYERDRQKGFGLGLAIARRLARQLGGDLTVDSAVGCGSRFTIALPGVVVSRGVTAQPDANPVSVGDR